MYFKAKEPASLFISIMLILPILLIAFLSTWHIISIKVDGIITKLTSHTRAKLMSGKQSHFYMQEVVVIFPYN